MLELHLPAGSPIPRATLVATRRMIDSPLRMQEAGTTEGEQMSFPFT